MFIPRALHCGLANTDLNACHILVYRLGARGSLGDSIAAIGRTYEKVEWILQQVSRVYHGQFSATKSAVPLQLQLQLQLPLQRQLQRQRQRQLNCDDRVHCGTTADRAGCIAASTIDAPYGLPDDGDGGVSTGS